MSKILRRPMFRGGAVDSRGTGITSGLFDAPSYNTGGRVGYVTGELVKGLDLNPSLKKPLEIKPVNTNTPKYKGPEYFKEKEEAESYVPEFQSMEDFNKGYEEYKKKEQENVDTLIGTEFGTGTFEDSEQERLKYIESDQGKSDYIAKKQAEQDKKIIEANKFRDQKLKTSKEMFADDDEIDLNKLKITEEPTVDPKDLINENKELFKELLGADKARGQDIGDMLLRFAGAPGSTTQEKFQTYLQAESQAGKGRLEKINETAAALAINDYVAGKRSKEQIESLKEVAKYKGTVAKGSIGAQILEQAKGGTVTSGMIEQVIKGNYPGSNVQKFPKGSISEGTIEIGKDDEGTFIIEEETKKAFYISGGKPVPIY
tara:strand:- start:2135 stop:3253 length:1119 start_codon:yes stop_codon:yes gene_type:complete